MKEEFVTYDLAVKLKEKGFRDRVRGHYKSKYHLSVCSELINCNGSASGDISAPQIHEVLKWIREDRKTHIIIDLDKRGWFCIFRCLRTGYVMDGTHLGYSDSFEQAAIAGIEYVIDNLI